jgi:peroxiredoxin
MPDLEAAYRAHRDEGLVVLGINEQDPPGLVAQFVEEMEVSFPILLDEAGRVMEIYRVPGLPTTVFVGREGVIRARHAGYLSAGQLEKYLAEILPGG